MYYLTKKFISRLLGTNDSETITNWTKIKMSVLFFMIHTLYAQILGTIQILCNQDMDLLTLIRGRGGDEDKWSASVLKKKSEKFDFFKIFSYELYFFSVKLNSMRKMLSFEVLHVEIAQKLQNLEFSLIFNNFLKDLEFSPFFANAGKKNSEKGAK